MGRQVFGRPMRDPREAFARRQLRKSTGAATPRQASAGETRKQGIETERAR